MESKNRNNYPRANELLKGAQAVNRSPIFLNIVKQKIGKFHFYFDKAAVQAKPAALAAKAHEHAHFLCYPPPFYRIHDLGCFTSTKEGMFLIVFACIHAVLN